MRAERGAVYGPGTGCARAHLQRHADGGGRGVLLLVGAVCRSGWTRREPKLCARRAGALANAPGAHPVTTAVAAWALVPRQHAEIEQLAGADGGGGGNRDDIRGEDR